MKKFTQIKVYKETDSGYRLFETHPKEETTTDKLLEYYREIFPGMEVDDDADGDIFISFD